MSRKKVRPQRATSGADSAPEDGDAFRRAVAGARPIEIDTVEPVRRRLRPRARFTREDERQVLIESLQADIDTSAGSNGEGLFFRHPSVNRRTMRRLARGGYSVQNELDLHGLTAAGAEAALKAFIVESLRSGHHCVRIVHGKGLRSGLTGPVLKPKVDQWLRRWQPVLAFVSARQTDGGTGAVYVLLRKDQ